jgi:hypothetical protein
MEQAGAEMVFEQSDLPGDGRGAAVGFPGDGGEGADIGDAREGLKGGDQVHDFTDFSNSDDKNSPIIFSQQEDHLRLIDDPTEITDQPSPAKPAGNLMEIQMSSKTLILAAAAVLSLGVGSAFAATNGSSDNARATMASQNTQTAQQAPGQYGQATGQSTTPVYHYVPDWIQRSMVGGGD